MSFKSMFRGFVIYNDGRLSTKEAANLIPSCTLNTSIDAPVRAAACSCHGVFGGTLFKAGESCENALHCAKNEKLPVVAVF